MIDDIEDAIDDIDDMEPSGCMTFLALVIVLVVIGGSFAFALHSIVG